MSKNFFVESIIDGDVWRKLRQSKENFMPLIKYIYEANKLKFNEASVFHEQNAQKTLNILRKTVLNVVRIYRHSFEPKRNMVDIMRNCLFDDDFLLLLLERFDTCV